MLAAPGTAHQGVQPRLQLRQGEGLEQEIVRPRVQRGHPDVQRILCRQNQRGQPLVTRPQALQHHAAIHAGQPQVQHQGVVIAVLQGAIGQQAVVQPVDLDPRMLQRLAQPGAQGLFIFNQQDSHRWQC